MTDSTRKAVLRLLRRRGGITITALAAQLKVTKQSAYRYIDSLRWEWHIYRIKRNGEPRYTLGSPREAGVDLRGLW